MGRPNDEVTFPLGGLVPVPPEGKTVAEPARAVPVLAECDVAVLGGGPAGACAVGAPLRVAGAGG